MFIFKSWNSFKVKNRNYNFKNIINVFGEDIFSFGIGDGVMWLIIRHNSLIQIAIILFLKDLWHVVIIQLFILKYHQ